MYMKINAHETKTMIISRRNITHTITVEREQIERVTHFKYLGNNSENGKVEREINEHVEDVGIISNSCF